MSKSLWLWLGGAAVVVIIILVIVIPRGGTPQQSDSQTAATISTSSQPNASGSAATATTSAKANTVSQTNVQPNPPAPQKPAIQFITPVVGDLWKIGALNPISWNASSDATGQLYLIDAQTKNLIGLILDNVGPAQTSYSWNTRDVYLSPTDPSKKDVVPGTYMIVLSFEQNHLPQVISPAFVIQSSN